MYAYEISIIYGGLIVMQTVTLIEPPSICNNKAEPLPKKTKTNIMDDIPCQKYQSLHHRLHTLYYVILLSLNTMVTTVRNFIHSFTQFPKGCDLTTLRYDWSKPCLTIFSQDKCPRSVLSDQSVNH